MYNKSMKQITITENEFDVLTDIFASIAELDMDEVLTDEVTFDQLWDKVLNAKEVAQMSCLRNEEILENIFDEVCEEFPNNTQEQNESIAQQRFEDLSQ